MQIQKTPENYMRLAQYIFDRRRDLYLPCEKSFTAEEDNHIVRIAASVMMTRDKVLTGGGFAQAIVDNNLKGAFDRADSIMIHAIRFLVYIANSIYLETDIEFTPFSTNQ